MEVFLEFLADYDTAEDALFVAEETHDCAGGDGDESMQGARGEATFVARSTFLRGFFGWVEGVVGV